MKLDDPDVIRRAWLDAELEVPLVVSIEMNRPPMGISIQVQGSEDSCCDEGSAIAGRGFLKTLRQARQDC